MLSPGDGRDKGPPLRGSVQEEECLGRLKTGNVLAGDVATVTLQGERKGSDTCRVRGAERF